MIFKGGCFGPFLIVSFGGRSWLVFSSVVDFFAYLRAHQAGRAKKIASHRRFSRLLREGFLDFEGVLQWFLEGGRVRRRVLRRGSKKGVSKRHLEGRNTPFREHDPLPVRPIFGPLGAERPQDENTFDYRKYGI